MASEKAPPLLFPNSPFEEKRPKNKNCSKHVIVWILSALLVALIVALCVQFLVPTTEKLYETEIDTVHEFRGKPVEVQNKPLSEETRDEKVKNKIINEPWHLDFIINPTRLCDSLNPPDSELYEEDPEVKLLALVPSEISHFAQRTAIRETWGSVAEKPHGPIRLGFVLGTTSNSTVKGLVLRESESYGDIIQADFEDTHSNRTAKSVLMLKWASKHCPRAQYFLKADDDTFVNLRNLPKLLEQDPITKEDKFIRGYIHKGAQPSRGPGEKYYVSESDYPNEQYPPYASSSAYVTTGSTVAQLFDAAKLVKPLLPMENVFVTGLCADQIEAALIHDPSFRFKESVIEPPWDSYSTLTTIHSVSPQDMDFLWNELAKAISDNLNISEDSSSETTDEISFTDLWNWQNENALIDRLKYLNSQTELWHGNQAESEGLGFGENKVNIDWRGTQISVDVFSNWPEDNVNSDISKDEEILSDEKDFLDSQLIPYPIKNQESVVFNAKPLILR